MPSLPPAGASQASGWTPPWLIAFFLAGPLSSWNRPLLRGRVSADHQLTTECRLQPITDTHSSMAPFFFLCNYHTRTAHFRKVVKTRWENGSCNPSVQNRIRSVIMHSCGLYKSTSVLRPLTASAAASHDSWRGAPFLPLVLGSVLFTRFVPMFPGSRLGSAHPALVSSPFLCCYKVQILIHKPIKAPLAQNVGHPQKLVSSSPV